MNKRKFSTNVLTESNSFHFLDMPSKQPKLLLNNEHLSDEYKELMENIDFGDFSAEKTNDASKENSQQQQQDDADARALLVDMEMDDFETDQGWKTAADYLDLSSWKRCIVDECERDAKTNDLILRGRTDVDAENCCNEKTMMCRLQGSWSHTKININDVVSLQAEWSNDLQCFCVTNKSGFAVVRPDFLVSGTSVVGALFCLRKSVLSDRFRGIDATSDIVSVRLISQ